MTALRQWLGGLVLLAVVGPLSAQVVRDPTLPPGMGQGSGSAPRGTGSHWPVIIIDGKPHLVAGTRLYAEGQQLGTARIERITETEVWLREGGQLRKVSNFSAVRRRTVTETDAPPCPPGAASAPVSQASGAACDRGRP